MNPILAELALCGQAPGQTVRRSMEETGKKAVGCFPVYVPEELIDAAGLLPVGLWGGSTSMQHVDKYLQSFCCSIMRANVELGMKGAYDMLSAVVITAYCDTLRAVMVNWPYAVPKVPVIPFVYPQNRQGPAALQYTLDIFAKFRRELEGISGSPITDAALVASFEVYEAYREEARRFVRLAAAHPVTVTATTRHYVLKAAWYMDKRSYTRQLREANDALEALPEEEARHRVVVTGLLAEPAPFLDIFAENGIAFAADDLAQESRQFRTAARSTGTVYEKLAYRMLDLRGDTFFYEENKSRGAMLTRLVQENKADAVVVCMYKFCDPEEFDYPVYKAELEAAGIPVLYLEIEQQMDSVEQLRTRVQSFAEML